MAVTLADRSGLDTNALIDGLMAVERFADAKSGQAARPYVRQRHDFERYLKVLRSRRRQKSLIPRRNSPRLRHGGRAPTATNRL